MGLKRILSLACAALILSMPLAGCSTSDVANEAEASTKEAEQGIEEATEVNEDEEKVLNMALFWLDSNIDPVNGWNGWTLLRTGVGENLINIDENMQFKYSIAEAHTVVDEKTTEFTIREDVYFHNGKKVDAQAVKKSIERTLEKTDRGDVTFDLESITADGQKLTIVTAEPFPTLINALADTPFIIVDADAATEEGFEFKPVCTGTFKVESFNPDKGLVLHKFDQHWSAKTNVDVVNVLYIPDAATRTMALQSGELDFATQLNPTDLALFENNEDFQVQKGPNLRIFLLRLNMDKPYMSELKFRQALSYGMDKETYAVKLANGKPAKGPFNENLPFAYKGEDMYQYDPVKANALLDELGYMDTDNDGIRELNGQNIVLDLLSMTNHGSTAKNIGIAMQQQYKEIGIGVNVEQLESYRDRSKSGDFDMLWERWTSAPTADSQYFIEAGYLKDASGNLGHYSNPEVESIVAELERTFDKAKRDALGVEATEILMEDVASLYLYYQEGQVITNKRVSGVERYTSEMTYIDDRVMVD